MLKYSFKNLLFVILKIAVSGTLLTIVFRKAGLQNIIINLQAMNVWFFILSSLLSFSNVFLTSLRWRILLGVSPPIETLFSFSLIGSFFNNLLPGAVGGDAVKAYYLYRETRQGGKSIASVFLDRYMGYTGLMTIGFASGMVAFNDLQAINMQWITPLLFLAFIAASLLVFGLRIGRRFATVADFYDFFHTALRSRRTILTAFALSLFTQLLTILSVYCIMLGTGHQPPFVALFVFVPLIVTFMALPISISGLGLREGAFVLLFGLIGISAEVSTTISFLWFLSIAAASLPGLVLYLRLGKLPPRE